MFYHLDEANQGKTFHKNLLMKKKLNDKQIVFCDHVGEYVQIMKSDFPKYKVKIVGQKGEGNETKEIEVDETQLSNHIDVFVKKIGFKEDDYESAEITVNI